MPPKAALACRPESLLPNADQQHGSDQRTGKRPAHRARQPLPKQRRREEAHQDRRGADRHQRGDGHTHPRDGRKIAGLRHPQRGAGQQHPGEVGTRDPEAPRAVRKTESRQQQRRSQRQSKCGDRDGADVNERIDGFGRHARRAPQCRCEHDEHESAPRRRAAYRVRSHGVRSFTPPRGSSDGPNRLWVERRGQDQHSKARAPLAGSSEGSGRLPVLCAGGRWGQKTDVCGQWHGSIIPAAMKTTDGSPESASGHPISF